MYRTQQMHAFTALMALWIGISLSTARAADYRWTGGGADAYWSTLDNWEEQVGGDWIAATTPPGADDVVYLGDAAPDASQEIVLDGNAEIEQIVMQATGERDYTVSSPTDAEGDNLYVLRISGSQWLDQHPVTTQDLILNVEFIGITNPGSSGRITQLDSLHGARIVVNRRMTAREDALAHWATEGTSDSTGVLALRAPISADRLYIRRQSIVLFNYEGTHTYRPFWPRWNAWVWVQKDTHITNVDFFNATDRPAHFRIFGSDADVRVRLSTDLLRGGPESLRLYDPEDGSAGRLLLSARHLTANTGARLEATTTLEIRTNQEAPSRADRSAGIHGEGRLIKDGSGIIGDRNTNTGGTFIEAGTLTLVQATIPEYEDGPEIDFAGQLGPGLLQIADGATFDLNGIDQTVARLQGAGTVQLGGGMLSATNGVAPGTNSVGMLTVEGSGELALAGASVFDFVDADTFDQVLFTGDADLTLGGTLEVQVPEAYDNTRTRYTIFALNGGTIHGAFDAILVPDDIWAEIDTSIGDVELILSPPGGTTILIR